MHPPVVLGLDFGGSKVAVAVSGVDGARLGTTTVAVRAGEGAQATFDRGIACARTLLEDAAAGGALVAVGACTFGIPRDDGVDLAPNIAGWAELAFGRQLRAAFPGAEIRTVTDVKAAARAEAEHGALVGRDPGLYLNLGTGLAAAVVTDGRVLSGHNGAAGEIGYSLRRPGEPDPAARLEEAVSGKALAALADDLELDGDVSALFELAASDATAARRCDEILTELAFHLVNLTIAIDPERVVVGGGLVRSWEHIEPVLTAALQRAVPYPPDLVRADEPYDAPLLGALALGVDAAQHVLAHRVVPDVLSEGAPA